MSVSYNMNTCAYTEKNDKVVYMQNLLRLTLKGVQCVTLNYFPQQHTLTRALYTWYIFPKFTFIHGAILKRKMQSKKHA